MVRSRSIYMPRLPPYRLESSRYHVFVSFFSIPPYRNLVFLYNRVYESVSEHHRFHQRAPAALALLVEDGVKHARSACFTPSSTFCAASPRESHLRECLIIIVPIRERLRRSL